MGGDAERQPGLADFVEVGVDEIFLAEMQMLCAGNDRRAPVVVDHELWRRVPLGHLERVADDLQRLRVVELLGAQLDGADAEHGQSRHPGDAVDDGVEDQDTCGDQDTACQNGVPMTGVEGEAKSRASISPAS